MESIIKIRNLKIPYISDSSISLDIDEGEIVMLTGPNGSGKSTLAAYIAGLYMPEEPDKVVVGGFDTSFPANIPILHRKCAVVLQNPEDNHVFDMASADIMFGLENLNTPADETVKKTKGIMKRYGLLNKADRNLRTLSEGEKQRAAVAAILLMEPHILVLDEAFSMQSDRVREKMLDHVVKEAREKKQTVLIITQRPETAKYCDRVIRLDRGKVVERYSDVAETVIDNGNPEGKDVFLATQGVREPQLNLTDEYDQDVADVLNIKEHKMDSIATGLISELDVFSRAITRTEINSEVRPIYIEERVIGQSKEFSDVYEPDDSVERVEIKGSSEALLLDRVSFTYGREMVLANVSYAFKRGRVYLVRGESGSGKSTLAMLLNGLLMAKKGRVYLDGKALPVTKLRRPNPVRQGAGSNLEEGILFDINSLRRRVGYVSQNPDKMLFADSVIKDVMFGPKNMGFDNNSAVRSAREALTYMNVDEMLWQRSVQALSGGEKRRVGIAGILANTPDYLILDESDAGLDETGIDALSGVVKSYLEAGRCVIFITH